MLWVEEKSLMEDRQARLPGRRDSYKSLHRKTAEKKGVLADFLRATTITQMKKILRG